MIYNEPSGMLGRVALRGDRTLFLFVFAADGDSLRAHETAAQKAQLRERFGSGRWECARILERLDEAPELYYDRVSQIHMGAWSRGRVALLGDAAFCVSLMAGQGSALAMAAGYVLAGELGGDGGRHDEAFRNTEALLRSTVASKRKAAERFSAAFAPQNRVGPVRAEPGHQGVRHSERGGARVRAGHDRRLPPARLRLAEPRLERQRWRVKARSLSRRQAPSPSPVFLIGALANSPALKQSSAMRRLFLVRHAKAEPAVGRDDYERALTDRGREDARRVADALAARDMLPDVLIHSGALRTKQTAEIFAAEWPRRVELEEELALYDATPGVLFSRARALSDSYASIGLVGHNPGIGELAVSLAGSGVYSELRRMAAKYPTGAVAALDFPVASWDDIERKTALLALFLTPSEIEAGTD